MALPAPKFAVGDTVFTADIERIAEKLPCPDCHATGKWDIKSPAGEVFTIDCPRCSSGHISMSDLPKLVSEKWIRGATPRRKVLWRPPLLAFGR